MTTKALGICDVCGFRYPLKELKKNSYGMMVCSMDYEGKYDLNNHPQNHVSRITGTEEIIRDARPQVPSLVSSVPVSSWLPSD